MKRNYVKRWLMVFLFCLSIFMCKCEVFADATYNMNIVIQNVQVNENGNVNLTLYNNTSYYSYYYEVLRSNREAEKYFEVYRSNQPNGSYELVGTKDWVDPEMATIFTDKGVAIGDTAYYKIRIKYCTAEEEKYGEFGEIQKVVVVPSPGKIKTVKATKAKTFTIKWDNVKNIDGYEVYVKEFENQYLGNLHYYSQYEIEGKDSSNVYDTVNQIRFKKVASISNRKKSYTYKKAKHGKGYIFAIKSYKSVGGKKVVGNIMYCAHGVMDYYYCENAENKKYTFKWPKSERQAKKLMTTIKVKTWDYKNHAAHKGAKKTRYQWITVNKKYAATIKQIYKEIYKSKEKPPIYEAGSYRWRPEESTWSYHTVGTAIDMNCNENPYYTYNSKGKRVISVGSFYKPKKNGYSIPRYGVIENTFLKYGFYRLNNDLMHFNTDGYVYPSCNY